MAITLNKLYPGKLEPGLLEELITKYTSGDERLVQGAKYGEDAAVIDMGGDRLLVLKSDPITCAAKDIGTYAVHINANDIVCMGAIPKWFLATILLPERARRTLAGELFAQISRVCREQRIAYCGGHVEVSAGLDRPIISGHMAGEMSRSQLMLKSHIKAGDHVVLVQSIPVETVSILAREKSKELAAQFSKDFVEKCRNVLYDPGISIRRYAEIARKTADIHAMHDPTEGGLATAIHEFASAAGLGVTIDQNKIPVSVEGKLACDFFDLNPLGCIASGSLLLAVPYKSIAPLLKAYAAESIPAADIGKFVDTDQGYVLVNQDRKRKLPMFARDEIIKVL